MALADSLKALREVELSELTLDNIGTWPMAVKVVVWVLVFLLVCFLGYNYHLKSLGEQYEAARENESRLRDDFRMKAFQVANLDALRAQLAEMEEQFGTLLSQLPKDTEVPDCSRTSPRRVSTPDSPSTAFRSKVSVPPRFMSSCRSTSMSRVHTTTSAPSPAAWPACRGS